jgi:hypothetical protein
VNVLIAVILAAFTVEPQLRSPLTQNEAEAQSVLSIAEEMGWEARLLKNYQHGLGWQYSVRVRGFESADAAEAAGKILAEKSGRGVDVLFEEASDDRVLVPPLSVLPAAQDFRMRIARSLGGHSGGRLQLSGAKALSFSFSRSIPKDNVLAHHQYGRSAGYFRCEVTQPADSEKDFLVLRGPQGDWVKSSDGLRPLGTSQMSEISQRFGPEAVYASILALPELLLEDSDYLSLRVTGQGLIDFRNAIRMESTNRHGKVILWADAGSGLPISWAFHSEAGLVQWIFGGWRALESNLILPTVMEVYGGGQMLDQIRLEEIQLSPLLSADFFSLPEMP